MPEINRQIIERKLTQLRRFTNELKEVLGADYDDYSADFRNARTAERAVELAVELAADIIHQFLLAKNLPPASSYRDSFLQAAKANIIPTNFAERLVPFASLRNRLIHEYDEEFDPVKAYEGFRAAPEAFRVFAETIFALLAPA